MLALLLLLRVKAGPTEIAHPKLSPDVWQPGTLTFTRPVNAVRRGPLLDTVSTVVPFGTLLLSYVGAVSCVNRKPPDAVIKLVAGVYAT